MEKHKFGDAKVFYDNEGRIYYQGQQNQSPRGNPAPAHSEPLPDGHNGYRSYNSDRHKKKRNHQYEESFMSLDHGLDINDFRRKGYQVVRDEKYDPYSGKPVQDIRGPPRDHPSPMNRHHHRGEFTSQSPDQRPLPQPPRNEYHDKGSWQRSFDRHPLMDDRYNVKAKQSTGHRCLSVFYVLLALLVISVGIVKVLICGEYHYYFHFWAGLLVLIAGIFGFIHNGDYSKAWKTWCYVIFAIVATVSTSVAYAFLMRTLSPQTTAISLLATNLSQYAALAMPQDPHVTVTDQSVTWVCYSMDWLSFLCLLISFTFMSSAIVIFNKFWEKTWTTTNNVDPFCKPALFNPWGQAQLGQAMIFFGVLTVYTCTAEASDTFWAKYWSPVWAGGLTIVAGWVSGITGKREDIMEAALAAVFLQIVSLCASVTAIVLCTLGLVDNINTAQDMDNDSQLGSTQMRDLTVASAVFYTMMDAVLLVNVFYTIGGMVRHLSAFCNGIRTKQKKRLPYGESASSHSGYPTRHMTSPPQHNNRGGPTRYGEYPSYDRNVGNGYHQQPQRY